MAYPEGTGGIKPASGIEDTDIRDNIPSVDTTIDPTEFASDSNVAVADVATLTPPEDIDPATIDEYTAYDDVSGAIEEDSTVEGRLSGLLSQNSDYIQRARTDAAKMSNRRGLLNSSMAAGAAQGAAIDRALPIAQQDAAAFKEQQFINQGYSNDAARYLAEQSVQRENLEAGFEQDTNQFNSTQSFQANQIDTAAQNAANTAQAAEQNKNNFAVLTADLQSQLAGIDNELAMNLQTLVSEFDLLENLDSINGSIYQQMIAEIGTILANEDKVNVAQQKINNLLAASGVEFAFSNGQQVGGGSGLNPVAVTPSAPPVAPGGNPTGGGGGDGGGSGGPGGGGIDGGGTSPGGGNGSGGSSGGGGNANGGGSAAGGPDGGR